MKVAPLSLYKPPPPYPGYSGTLFSSSTPDLATHTGATYTIVKFEHS